MPHRVAIIDKPRDCLTVGVALRAQPGINITGIYSQWEKAISHFGNNPPDYLILDPNNYSEAELRQIKTNALKYKAQIFVFSTTQHASLSNAMYVKKPQNLARESKELTELVQQFCQLQASKTPPVPKVKTVFLIDDSALMKMVIETEIIHKAPHLQWIGSAKNGREALTKLEELQADFILLDLEMPDMNGFEFLKQIRAKSNAKIIVISAIAQAHQQELQRLGADAIINKPQGSVSLSFGQDSGAELLKVISALNHENI